MSKFDEKPIYYVYSLIDPRNGLEFYVGKGKGNRAQSHILTIKKGKRSENRWKDHIIQKLLETGRQPLIAFIAEGLPEKHAYDLETKMIAFFGRNGYDEGGILVNVCKDNNPPDATGKHWKLKKPRKPHEVPLCLARNILSKRENA